MNSAPPPFGTSSFASSSNHRPSWPVTDDDWQHNKLTYRYVGQRRRATADSAPLPPGGHSASLPPGGHSALTTTLATSSGRAKMSPFAQGSDDSPPQGQQHDSPAEMHQPRPSCHVRTADKATRANSCQDEVEASTAHTRSSRKRTAREEQVPEQQQHDQTAKEQEVHALINCLKTRVEYAAKRVTVMGDAEVKLRHAQAYLTAKKTLALDQAGPLEKAVTTASNTLKLSRAELSAATARKASFSRPRRAFYYLKAKWDTAPLPDDMFEAQRQVAEAVRALSSARAEADRAWEVVGHYSNKAEAASGKLSMMESNHIRAKAFLVDLEAELDGAKHDAVHAERDGGASRFLAREFCPRMKAGVFARLLAAAEAVKRLEDDDVGRRDQEVAFRRKKRARY